MNINEQEKTENFVYKHDIECKVPERLLDLSSEFGELAKLVLKETEYGKKEFVSNAEIDDKMGQLYLVFLELANEIGVNLDDAFKRALETNDLKLGDKEDLKRYPLGRNLNKDTIDKLEKEKAEKKTKKRLFNFKKEK